MVPPAGFADVLTSPFSKQSGNWTNCHDLLRNSVSKSQQTPEQPPCFDWELNSVSHGGTFCTVTQARPPGRNGQYLYAFKRLKPEWQESPVGRAMIQREAELGRLISHPHVVPTLDENTVGDEPYLVQPWLRGKTLREFLTSGRNANPVETIWIARQIAEGLAALEKHGFCHCDVKPGNIIVSPNGHATLIDLGLARHVGEPLPTLDRAVGGTPKYMAPELADLAHPTAMCADLYSLGLVMLELLFGKAILLSDGVSCRINVNQWHTLWESLGNRTNRQQQLLAELESLLRSMADPDAAKRPDSAEMVVRRLVSIELAAI
ncbi:MAG: serine/threonine protein kinase [Planctomycetaceae bacterium]|nr:serine/threonine protein kinase [Planctomycetaceae bacterium]